MRGFSVLEFLVALFVLTLSLSGGVLVILGLPQAAADGHTELLAAWRAEGMLLEGMQTGAQDISGLVSWYDDLADGFTQSLTVELLPDDITKRLTSMVSWTDEHGNPRSITFSALFAPLYDPSATSSCDQPLQGNWKAPTVATRIFSEGDLLPFGSTTPHPVSGLATATSSLLAATINNATNKTDATLFLFSLTNPQTPAFLGSADNATSTKSGIAALAVANGYAFAANAVEPDFSTCKTGPSCSQLEIFDIRNPSVPQLVSSFQLSATSVPFATGSSGQSAGRSIEYAHGRIYLGLQKTGSAQGEEFNIIDAHDPQAPVWLGGFSVGRSITSIRIRGPYAYITTDDPTRELLILDVHDPTHITQLASYNAPGNPIYGYGDALDFASSTAFLARTYTPNQFELSLISLATVTAPAFVGGAETGAPILPFDVNAVFADGPLVFALTSVSLDLWDISHPPQPILYATPVSLPAAGTALACFGNTLYASSVDASSTGYLTILTGS